MEKLPNRLSTDYRLTKQLHSFTYEYTMHYVTNI